MKIVIIIVSMLALVGVFVGLLFLHVIKTDQLAKSSPAAASILKAMGLYKPPKAVPASTAAAVSAPPPDFTAEKQALEQERGQLEAQRAALQKQAATPPTPTLAIQLSTPQSQMLVDIYDTMGADDLAKIFDKQSDPEVVRSLAAMDERKAGKVLAALPPDRAAKLTVLLSRMPQPGDSTSEPGTSADSTTPETPNSPTDPNAPTTVAQVQ